MATRAQGRSGSPQQDAPAIAVVGMGLWAPGAHELREFWENVLARRRQFRQFPELRLPLSEYWDAAPDAPDKTYATRGAFIDGYDFDWVARRIPERTYESTDIVHWLALDVALKALEDAGYTRESVPTHRSAALVGNSLTGEFTRSRVMRLRWPYVRRALRAAAEARGLPPGLVADLELTMEDYYKSVFPPVTEDTLAGVLSNTIAGRICNYLDLHGGGYVVDGACASGMIAVATAASALAAGDIDLALAGGVDISLDPLELVGFAKVGALTHGDMNVYDARGSGFIPGEGCGFVVLKRLEDARADGDDVYAVIRGWGISSDGKGGITKPRADSQAEMLRRAYDRAPYGMADLAFIEGHGTGTPVGDRAELEGIQLASASFGPAPARSIGMTSLKSLVGHTKAASGILGLIKTVIAVNRRVLPPFAGFGEPNTAFAEAAPALYPIVHGEVRDPGETIRAGAQAMGFGGINCHVTVESGDAPSPRLEPEIDERTLMASYQETELFLLTAHSTAELQERALALRELAVTMSMAEQVDLAAELAQAADQSAPVRAAVVAGMPSDLVERLELLAGFAAESPPGAGELRVAPHGEVVLGHAVHTSIGFLFPGQGSQQLGMARVLVERFAWARELVEQADEWLLEVGSPPVGELMLRDPLRARDAEELEEWTRALAQTEVTQPAVALASIIWLRYLERLGVRPAAVAGHSLGEVIAFHAAGAYDERTLIEFAAAKGRAMASPAGAAGTMASLACGRGPAEALCRSASGYVAVANINSPTQTVVGGEPAAVDEVVAAAAVGGIRATRLKVSNAFHTALMEGAEAILRETAPVAETVEELQVPLYSCLDGSHLQPPFPIREYMARQVVSQVDWVTLVERLSQRCDLFVEVGPGRVLSGLVNAINGSGRHACLPVESRPGRDRDLNVVLAALFARGVTLDPRELYAGRLTRPFVPAAERRFIENPIELPFQPSTTPEPTIVAQNGNGAGDPAGALADYLGRRGQFLVDVIRADLGGAAPLRAAAPAPVEIVAPPARAAAAPPAPEAPALDVERRLVELIAAQTGFPADSIPLGSRLLDDLNLDSIKAAELVGAAARELGVAEELDPAELANATVAEVAEAIRQALPAGTPAAGAAAGLPAAAVLVEVVSRHTGFPPDSISLEMRLLDDLNVDSIKAAEIVAEAADRLGIAGELDPSELANATIAEIAAVLEASRTAPVTAAAPAPDAVEQPSWVRDFAVEPVEQELSVVAAAPELAAAAVLVVADLPEADVAFAVAAAFRARGAAVQTASYADEPPTELSHVVAILPRRSDAAVPPEDALWSAVERLRAYATPARAGAAAAPPGLVYLQFGGLLSGGKELGVIGHGGAGAFAAGVHHERPDLRVRVVDAAPGLDPDAVAERVLAELAAPESFAFAGYDAELVRRVLAPRVLEPVDYEPRPLDWSAEDVVLVTGGAKGITAECALALARSTGARMALAGRSAAEPDGEIAATLSRFEGAGLTARYFQCDVADRAAVAQLVARVREELGPVTAVVHGAGANQPRRVEQVDVEAAYREAAPKVLGAVNLAAALADEPPKLFVGFSSIIGVTGMPGNSWYGFANETLDSVLARFGAEHPETAVLSLAYSVWGEVGMGVRLGSAQHLAKMGVAAIRTDDGVARFLRLVQGDPGAQHVVVAARLRGLDTWRPAYPAFPHASRYLEGSIELEPGVEVVARTRLTLEDDAYVADHVWKGSPLLPTVFGLEAMAQAVAYVTGVQELGRLRIEDIRLDRPIVVDAVAGIEIEVRAELLEREAVGEPRRVRASIGTAQTGFSRAHFAAEFVLGIADEAPVAALELPDRPLDVDPEQDLYGWLLFQGPQFHRLRALYELDSTHCLFRADALPETGSYLLGDPFFRDALLQSGQLVVPQEICLPTRIDSIELYPARSDAGARIGLVFDKVVHDGFIEARVVAVDEEGNVVELLDGYRSRILEHRADNPTAEEIANPTERDAELLRRELVERAHAFAVAPPEVSAAYLPGLHGLSRDERHRLELPVFEEAVARLLANGAGRPG